MDMWVAGWLVLAVGASSLSGYGDELAAFSVVIALGIIVSGHHAEVDRRPSCRDC